MLKAVLLTHCCLILWSILLPPNCIVVLKTCLFSGQQFCGSCTWSDTVRDRPDSSPESLSGVAPHSEIL